jgi:hypothetical protein
MQTQQLVADNIDSNSFGGGFGIGGGSSGARGAKQLSNSRPGSRSDSCVGRAD